MQALAAVVNNKLHVSSLKRQSHKDLATIIPTGVPDFQAKLFLQFDFLCRSQDQF